MTNSELNSPNVVLPRGAIMLPEVSADAYLVVTIDALEALENLYDAKSTDGYVVHVFGELEKNTLSAVKSLAGLAVRSCTVDDLLASGPLDEVSYLLRDALSLCLYGRLAADELEHRQAKAIAAVEKMQAKRDAARNAAEAKANATA